LTNGMLRRDNSISSWALWWEARNKTACDFNGHPCFAGVEDLLGHVPGLGRLIGDGREVGPLFRLAVRPQVFREPLCRKLDHAIAGIENGLGGPVILFKRDDPSRWLKLTGKIENVADRCRPERIDRLGIVADDCQPAASGFSFKRMLACSLFVSWYSSTKT
jgi:hypothetical protein